MNKCHICNDRFPDPIDRDIVSIYQVPKGSVDLPLIESDKFVYFCAECLWQNCDSKLKHFHDRFSSNCLYCNEKVDTSERYFYFLWERSFDVINSQMIHGKCYNDNVGIYEKRKDKLKKKSWGTTFANFAFPLVRQVFPSLIANQITSVQPMTMSSGLLDFLDKKLPPGPDEIIVSPKTYKLLEQLEKDKKI